MSWFPVAMRFTGLLGVVFVAAVWLLTNRVEPSLLALFGSMVGIGEGADAIRELGNRPPPPDGAQPVIPPPRTSRRKPKPPDPEEDSDPEGEDP